MGKDTISNGLFLGIPNYVYKYFKIITFAYDDK